MAAAEALAAGQLARENWPAVRASARTVYSAVTDGQVNAPVSTAVTDGQVTSPVRTEGTSSDGQGMPTRQ